MLKINDLSFRYSRHSSPVLSSLDMELGDGEVGVVLGRNGSGKTTLFKTILGICRPHSGEILLDGDNLLEMSERQRARIVSYVPQSIQFGSLTVFDSVLMGRLSSFGLRAGRDDYEKVERILSDMGLGDLAPRKADEISGGERQKVAIARAMAGEPRLLVLDEPTGNLDIANEMLLVEEARKLAEKRNISVLCSIHSLGQALAMGDRFYFMKDGRITHSGGDEIFTEETIRSTFGIPVRIVEVDGEKIIIGGKKG